MLLRIGLFLLAAIHLAAQDAPQPSSTSPDWFTDHLWLSGQANFIRQSHGAFPALYSGPNSLSADKEHATSRVLTLYTGLRLTSRLDFLFDLESAGGDGLSHALGVAGFPNVDVVRNPTLGSAPYVARVMLHYTLPLSRETTEATQNPLSLATTVPRRRLEFRLGKMSTVDFFDLNSVGSDSHLQFMNWTVVNNGAYDYAADTRGYTYGFLAEFYNPGWALRFGEMLMPKVANGIELDWNIARARAENIEFELYPSLRKKNPGVVRLLAFVNHANMGSYREAINAYLDGQDSVPDITAHRQQGRVKYGFGLNTEQQLTPDLRVFGRLGWNDGANESFAYTEVDRTALFGADYRGRLWKRSRDKIGAAFVINSISGDHRLYLALGGLGFLLGDGALNYGTERIFEAYYTLHIWRGVSFAFDVQQISNPGYNQDRGPVLIPGFRIHIEDSLNAWRVSR